MNERPTLKLYHANGKGTGCALSLAIEHSFASIAFGVAEGWKEAE